MKRKEPLATGSVHHILNKSIAGYNIFPREEDYQRMVQVMRFFAIAEQNLPKFSRFVSQVKDEEKSFDQTVYERVNKSRQVQIIAYCIMPTHVHFVLKQSKKGGISCFMGNSTNSYARYFNTKYKRKGRLWGDAFKNVAVKSDKELLHLTRYVHLNPVTAGLVKKPEDWKYSSYSEYVFPNKIQFPVCSFGGLIDLSPSEYRTFTEDQVDYQKALAIIKKIALE